MIQYSHEEQPPPLGSKKRQIMKRRAWTYYKFLFLIYIFSLECRCFEFVLKVSLVYPLGG